VMIGTEVVNGCFETDVSESIDHWESDDCFGHTPAKVSVPLGQGEVEARQH
jgi:hypothetical protein